MNPICPGANEANPENLANLTAAVRLRILGRVQGVGFRPFVVRLAATLGLAGWVRNTPEGLTIHLEGLQASIASFRSRLESERPPAAEIHEIVAEPVPARGSRGFVILPSELTTGDPGDGASPAVRVVITPDLAACPACLAEFDDPGDRRHGFALISCTDCGPRFSVQMSAPFDRERTTMVDFLPCPDCLREYADPADRRFHAQNIACPECGPRIWAEPANASESRREIPDSTDRAVLEKAAEWLCDGKIVAVKGIGGFHLLCDATSPEAVQRLRDRKKRDRKPFAVLFHDVADVSAHARVDQAAGSALADPSAPIVLLERRAGSSLADEVAPGLSTVGAFVAYTPLHQALVRLAARPLIATSGNPSDEPMPIENEAARGELGPIADRFLFHDRRILRHADDGLVRIIGDRPVPLRIGRGLAPVRIELPVEPPPLLATGGHLKAAIALTRGRELFLGQHIGDLDTPGARRRYVENVADLARLLGVQPSLVVHDGHPDYFTTRFADESGLPRLAVQHHHAHVMACLAEHGEHGPALGIAWDGTGYGTDGSIWGGEFLLVEGTRWRRVGSLLPFPLVGGDRAAREPRRSALGVCHVASCAVPQELGFSGSEYALLASALDFEGRRDHDERRASLRCLGVAPGACPAIRLRGRGRDATRGPGRRGGAGDVRGACPRAARPGRTPVLPPGLAPLGGRDPRSAGARGEARSTLAARFHNSLALGSVEIARRVGSKTVVLGGGCFQNRLLTERVVGRLEDDGFRVLTHRRVPPGDGGLAVGQAWAAALQLTR